MSAEDRVRRRIRGATRKCEEETIHREVVKILRTYLPPQSFFHTPNTHSSAAFRAKLNTMGLSPGVPDILIVMPPPCGGYVGAALEFKSDTGVVSPAQTLWLDRLSGLGWATAVVRSLATAVANLRAWRYTP